MMNASDHGSIDRLASPLYAAHTGRSGLLGILIDVDAQGADVIGAFRSIGSHKSVALSQDHDGRVHAVLRGYRAALEPRVRILDGGIAAPPMSAPYVLLPRVELAEAHLHEPDPYGNEIAFTLGLHPRARYDRFAVVADGNEPVPRGFETSYARSIEHHLADVAFLMDLLLNPRG